MAPSKWRGSFSTGFQFFIGLGVITANCIYYGTSKLRWGWRLSLGLAIVPATAMTIGVLLISDTPSSLVGQGKLEQAMEALSKVRGTNDNTEVEDELADLILSCEVARASEEEPFVTNFKRQRRPHLVMSIAIPFFQQMSGINIIAFYAPVLFPSVGLGNNSALLGAIILGLVNLGSILVSTGIVDRFDRRFLFIQCGVQMLICQLSSSIPVEIGKLVNLIEAVHSIGRLTVHIPPEIGNSINASLLNAFSNEISGFIPAETGKMTSVEELSLHTNNLSGPILKIVGDINSCTFIPINFLVPCLVNCGICLIQLEGLGKLDTFPQLPLWAHFRRTQKFDWFAGCRFVTSWKV